MFCYVCLLFGIKDSGIITAFRPDEFKKKKANKYADSKKTFVMHGIIYCTR